jgi:hypothetical protein
MNVQDNKAISDDPDRTAIDQGKVISQRKLNANRANAQKSTGPKTLRGKSYSRRNALKHGLFAKQVEDFQNLGATKAEFGDLLKSLCQHYQPVGKAEELEVERIAVCWWRLMRVWRFENSLNHISKDGAVTRSAQIEASCKGIEETAGAISVGVARLIDQVKRNGLFPDLQESFAALTKNKYLWDLFQMDAESMLDEVKFPKYLETQEVEIDVTEWHNHSIPFSPEYESARAILTLMQAEIYFRSVPSFKTPFWVPLCVEKNQSRVATRSTGFFLTRPPSSGALIALWIASSACNGAG